MTVNLILETQTPSFEFNREFLRQKSWEGGG